MILLEETVLRPDGTPIRNARARFFAARTHISVGVDAFTDAKGNFRAFVDDNCGAIDVVIDDNERQATVDVQEFSRCWPRFWRWRFTGAHRECVAFTPWTQQLACNERPGLFSWHLLQVRLRSCPWPAEREFT
jgi:hypothetical protein